MFRDTDGSAVDPSPVTYEDEVCIVYTYMYHTHSKWVFVLQIKEPTSDDETLISAQNSNKDGSSVDPIPIRDEVEVCSMTMTILYVAILVILLYILHATGRRA